MKIIFNEVITGFLIALQFVVYKQAGDFLSHDVTFEDYKAALNDGRRKWIKSYYHVVKSCKLLTVSCCSDIELL